MSVKAKMTAIADEIRELSGTSGAMGLDAMATNLGDANTEVSGQADLIAQIASALDGKASGGNIELPELINPASQEEVFLDKEFIDKDGKAKTGTFTIENELTEQDSLIAQIQSVVDNLPEAGSGSEGGTIVADVCSVSIPNYANNLMGISYVKCENGVCTQTNIVPEASNCTINNVLCNSIIYMHYTLHIPRPTTNCEDIYYGSGHYFIKLTALPEEMAVINIIYMDF